MWTLKQHISVGQPVKESIKLFYLKAGYFDLSIENFKFVEKADVCFLNICPPNTVFIKQNMENYHIMMNYMNIWKKYTYCFYGLQWIIPPFLQLKEGDGLTDQGSCISFLSMASPIISTKLSNLVVILTFVRTFYGTRRALLHNVGAFLKDWLYSI